MKNIIVIVLITFALPSILFSQYEKADAVYDKLSDTYTLLDDGSIEYHSYKKLTLKTHYSFNRMYGETFIVYNPECQKLDIIKAQTTMADGKVVEVPKNAFNEVLPRFAAGAPPFNHLREMVVTHTALEIGATIELEYKITTKAGSFPALMGNKTIESRSPVRSYEFIVRVPEGQEFHHRMINLRLAPEMMSENGQDIYIWRISNLPQESGDAHLPPADFYQPCLTYSSAKDLHRVYDAFVGQSTFQKLDLPESAKNIVRSFKEKFVAKNQLMTAIRDYVIQNINYWPVPLEYTNYQLRPIAEVWASNGATQAEKALLMTAMMREAGFTADMLAVIPGRLYEPAIGSLDIFEGFAVNVHNKEGNFVLSTTNKNSNSLIYEMPDKDFLVLDGAIESLKLIEKGKNPRLKADAEFEAELTLTSDGDYSGKGEIKMSQYMNDFLPWEANGPQKSIGSIHGFIGEKDILDFKTTIFNQEILEGTFSIKSNKKLKSDSSYYFIQLPVFRNGIAERHLTALPNERFTELYTGKPIEENYKISIELPDGARLLNKQMKIEKMKSFGNFKIELEQKGNKVIISRHIELNGNKVRASDYLIFRIFMNEWNNIRGQKLIILM